MKKYTSLLVVLFVGSVLFAIIFNGYFSEQKVLMSTDALISHSNVSFSEMLHSIGPSWKSSPLLGSPRGGGASLAWITKGLFTSGILWNNLYYGLACLAAFFVFSLYFIRRGFAMPVSVCCAIAAVWIGTNFTLIYPGHGHKPVVVLFFICSLFPVARTAAGSIVHAVIWGACIGLMFVQQPDISLFFALFAGAYLVFRLWKEQGFKVLQWLKILVPAAAVAFLFAVGPLLSGYEHNVKGTAQMEGGDPSAKWDYVTQWSVPPNEVVDFVAPGYYGWRSGEPEGPYWGRTGRSPGWEKTKQGFRNFKLESTYIGFIPVGFAIFALFACRRSKRRAEILFWAGAATIALLLSFGKYFPLYSLFYQLPVVNNIRNPNKFIQVFQVCLAVLAVYGFDALWRSREEDGSDGEKGKPVRLFFLSSLGALVVMGLWALIATFGEQGGIDGLVSQGWPREAADVIAQNKAASLWHAVFMLAALTGVLAVFTFQRFSALARHRGVIAALLVLVVAVDAIKLSKHYIKEMPRSYIASNALTRFLEDNLGEDRVAFLSQQGIDNVWITYLMPYNNIPTFNFTNMPRMANDYKDFLEAGQRNPVNMWRRAAVKYLLGPTTAEKQLYSAGCRKVFSYGLDDAGHGEFRLVQHPDGPFSVYELQGSLPRYALFAASRKVQKQHLLSEVLTNVNEVYLPESSSLPVLIGEGQVGSINVLSYRPGKVRLRVSTEVPAILRAADKFNPDWRATVDGKRVAVEPVDFICQGVAIPVGSHEVVLRYAPNRLYFCLQCLGMALLLGAFTFVVLRRKGGHVAD